MPGGSLAFLPPCERAMGHKNLADHAMCLESVISGKRVDSVQSSPTIADTFYERSFQAADGKMLDEPNPNSSVRALDVAVKKLLTFEQCVHYYSGGFP